VIDRGVSSEYAQDNLENGLASIIIIIILGELA
jgi:hypothetical protein